MKTPSYNNAVENLPSELKQVLDELIEDYKFYATVRHGKPYVSPMVLSDLIKAGWRRSAPSDGESR